MDRKRNASIDLFRIICAILVVGIHTRPIDETCGLFAFFWVNVVQRIAVPFFFSVSGYYIIQKMEKGENVLVSSIKKIYTIYFVWSCIYWLLYFLEWGYLDIKGYIKWLLFRNISDFFVTGTTGHFWYFPALAISMLVSWGIVKAAGGNVLVIISAFCFAAGGLMNVYYYLLDGIPAVYWFREHSNYTAIQRIVMQGFPYFVLGYFLYKIRSKQYQWNSGKGAVIAFLICFFIWIMEAVVAIKMQWARSFVLSFGQYVLILSFLNLLLAFPLPQFSTLSTKCRKLANFTYYSHVLIISLVNSKCSPYYNGEVPGMIQFIATLLLCFVTGSILIKIDNKTVNTLLC